MQTSCARILLVEDNIDHAMLIQSALTCAEVEVVQLPSAELAQDYLAAGDRLLALMLVDVKLPGDNGVAFLQWIKQHPVHQVTPVVMLSTSDNPRDITQAYRCGASGYFTKPVGLSALKAKLGVLLDYWLRASLLPKNFSAERDKNVP